MERSKVTYTVLLVDNSSFFHMYKSQNLFSVTSKASPVQR